MYIIKHKSFGAFSKIDTAFMVASFCENYLSYAKVFSSEKKAENFLKKWNNAGVGLCSEDCEVVSI